MVLVSLLREKEDVMEERGDGENEDQKEDMR